MRKAAPSSFLLSRALGIVITSRMPAPGSAFSCAVAQSGAAYATSKRTLAVPKMICPYIAGFYNCKRLYSILGNLPLSVFNGKWQRKTPD
jgi:hypothetical protein